MTATSQMSSSSEANASSPKRNRIPAKSALASVSGISRESRSNQPVRPVSVSSTAQNRKAPVASGRVVTPPPSARSAAPGVDQAVSTGMRNHSDRIRLVTPMPSPSARSQLLACA